MIVRELVTRLSYSYDGRGLNQSAKAVTKYTSQSSKQFSALGSFAAKTMGRSFSAISSAGMKAFAGLERGYNRVSRTISKGFEATIKFHGLDKVEGRVSKLNSGFRNMATLAAGAVGGLTLGGAAKSTLSAGGEFETQMARLTTIFGEQAASSVYKQMQQFAAKTPFEMPDIVDFVASTQGAGFNFLDKSGKLNMAELAAIGDQVAASGKKLPEMAAAMISAQRGLPNMMDNFVGLAGKVEDGGITTSMFDRKTGKQIKGRIGEDDPNRAAAIQDFFVRGGQREGIAGGMDRMSQTLPGKLSTLRDAVKNLQTQFYMGFQGNAHKFLDGIAKTVERLTPDMKRLGVNVGDFLSHDLPGYLEKTRKVLPFVVGSLGLMYAHMLGIGTLNFASKIYAISKALNVMGISGMIVNGVIAFIPMLIGLAVLAVGTLAADFIYFCTTGESYLLDFTEKWPGLHDKIRDAYYLVIELAKQVDQGFRSMGELMSMYLPPILDGLKVGFRRTLTPARVTLEIIVGLFKAIGDGIGWAIEQLGRLGNAIANLPGMDTLGRFFGGFEGGHGPNRDQGLTPVPMGSDLRGKANPIGSDLVKNAREVRNTAGYCLQAVAKMHNMTFGQSARHLATQHAADAANIISKSDKFREIKITKDMLKDPQYKALLHGATAVYPRGNGFSAKSGHIEVFDMMQQKAHFGRGGVPLALRSASQIASARVFVPVQNLAAPSPNRATGGAGGNTAQVQQVININGPTNAAAAGQAAKRGVEQVLRNNLAFTVTER